MGTDVLAKGVLFSESIWSRDVFHCRISGKRFKYTCLERGSCMSGKGVVNYPSLERGYHKCSFVYNGVICSSYFCLGGSLNRVWKGYGSRAIGITSLPFG